MSVLQAMKPVINSPKILQVIPQLIKTSTHKVGFHDKVKSTVVDKWGRYWKDLLNDYTDVFKETVDNCKKYPNKSLGLFSLLGMVYFSCKTNPDEINYREAVLNCSNDVLLVGKAIRSQSTEKFLTNLETCYNSGLLRRLNLGILSIMWIDNYSYELGIYKAECTYLKPQYLTFSSRIIDIGFLGKWWRLEKFMQDYDVNHEEWVDRQIAL